MLNHQGTHKTKREGYVCWNSQLINGANSVLKHAWMRFDASLGKGFDTYLNAANEEMDMIKRHAIGSF